MACAQGLSGAVRQEVGVYQGCPLSPYLFIAMLIPLERALHALGGVGVQLAPDYHECLSAYADDLKVFSSTADGVRRLHGVVATFLKWTTMKANATKCAFLPIRPTPTAAPPPTLHLDGEAIPTITREERYTFLCAGDGFSYSRPPLRSRAAAAAAQAADARRV